MVRVRTSDDFSCDLNLSENTKIKVTSLDLTNAVEKGELPIVVVNKHNKDENAHKDIVDGLKAKNVEQDGIIAQKADSSDLPVKLSDLTDDSGTIPLNKAITLDGLTVTVQELNNVSGIIDNVQTQLNSKQDTLESGTNIKTINSQSLLGSGDISISASLPETGSSSTPIYINSSGVPTACLYSLDSLASHSYQTSYSSVSDTSNSVVIKEYVSGDSGYRIWSTGYCIQWGRTACTGSSPVTISFTKTWKDTNYNINTIMDISGASSSTNMDAFIGTRSTSSVQIYAKTGSGGAAGNKFFIFWHTCGYLASGQY